jgi:hypothetical protein
MRIGATSRIVTRQARDDPFRHLPINAKAPRDGGALMIAGIARNFL